MWGGGFGGAAWGMEKIPEATAKRTAQLQNYLALEPGVMAERQSCWCHGGGLCQAGPCRTQVKLSVFNICLQHAQNNNQDKQGASLRRPRALHQGFWLVLPELAGPLVVQPMCSWAWSDVTSDDMAGHSLCGPCFTLVRDCSAWVKRAIPCGEMNQSLPSETSFNPLKNTTGSTWSDQCKTYQSDNLSHIYPHLGVTRLTAIYLTL